MILITAIFLVLLLIGMPLGFAIGIAGFTFFLTDPNFPVSISSQRIISSTQSFPLLAVPLFVLAGHLMNATGITRRLLTFASALTGWMAGGLAHTSIVLSALMGGISGSSVADASMEARILGPTMRRHGYAGGFTAAVIALSSLITSTIPPSIGLILYGFIGQVSVGRLFIAGVVPGILMTAVLMGPAYLISRRRGYRGEIAEAPGWREVLHAMHDAKYALIFPVWLIVGIRFGLFTPSEAGAFAVVYALLVGFFAHRELRVSDLPELLGRAVTDIGMIMLILMLSAMLGFAIIVEQVPQNMAAFIAGLSENPVMVLFLLLGFLVVAGMFVESTVMVLLLTPILVPIVRQLGIDDVHFGVLMVILVGLGSMTPPVGVIMYTVCGLLNVKTDEYVRESLPFILAILVLLTVLALFPDIVLFLPGLVYGS